MCSPISDGAAAVVLANEEAVLPIRSRVNVLASVVRSADFADPGARVTAKAADAAYEMAGLGPHDVDVAEVHDAAASAELSIYEQLGFAGEGEGADLIRRRATDLGGAIPVNPSGGLLARGHPIGATGLAQIVEIVTQLRGEAGPRQVERARIGLTQNAGGWHDQDNVVASIHLLGRAG
jgi:acetyl-CoA acyltransferase